MTRAKLQHQRRAVVFVAALVLFVQAFLTGWAVAAQPMRDAFGNVLCVAGSVDNDNPAANHAKAMDCCLAGGCFATAAIAAPQEDGAIIAWRGPALHVPTKDDRAVNLPQPDHDPGSPRGPPLA